MINLQTSDYQNILLKLQDFHAIFYNSWKMSKPFFSDSISTACVTFDENGKFLKFIFNKSFWEECSEYEKLFVICHETLHVILNHGTRFKDCKNNKIANTAMDLAINHSLINRFGFCRELMKLSDDLCWIDKFFDASIPDDENAEKYYSLLLKDNSETDFKGNSFDQHEFINEDSTQDFKNFIEQLDKVVSNEDKVSIKNFLNNHDGKIAGFGAADYFNIEPKNAKPKKKWESIIKKWCLRSYSQTELESTTWYKPARRTSLVLSDLFLPSDDLFYDFHYSENKVNVLFFLDTSGSCISLRNRFFTAAASLSPQKFIVDLFCFDTQVYATNLTEKRIYGGGGTSFGIIEEFIKQNYPKYPKIIFVMTDGLGDKINPEKPKNWHWFINHEGNFNFTKNFIYSYIPKECNVFDLSNFL